MKKSILVSLAALMLVGSAQADSHTKGTHKGHVHKSVGESCNDKCDDLRRQIEDLNASYQERLQALETSVEELEEVAHEHETLLLDPAEDSWTLGFDVWWADFSGGEQILAVGSQTNAIAPGVNATSLVSALVSNPDDDAAWTANIKFQDDADSSWGFRYTSADSNRGYLATSGGLVNTGGALIAGNGATGFASPLAAAIPTTGGVVAFTNGFASDVIASRSTDVDDLSIEKENRVWANEKFAVNWSWGFRSTDVDDVQSATFTGANSTNNPNGDNSQTVTTVSRFSGWGPTAGIKGRYYLSDDFEVQGNMGMGAMVGDNDFNFTVVENNPGLIVGAVTAAAATSTNTVNPVLDLGSRFVWHAGDDLDVHIGYSVTRYYDAITQFGGALGNKTDLSLDGIRAGIEWNFD